MIDATIQGLLEQATDVCGDSRLLIPGAVFVAMAGERRHGLVGLEEAIERGASAIIHDGQADPADLARLKNIKVPVVECHTLEQDLPAWLSFFFNHPLDGLTLHAVTGTNGKSSIAWLLAQALDGAMIGTIGTGVPGQHHKAELTTPSIFSMYRHLAECRHQGIQHVVIEASSHALVQGRLRGLSFETTIFTNLGHDHLDYHGDRTRYGQAKQRLFVEFASRHQLINVDDAFGAELFAELNTATTTAPTQVLAYGLSQHHPNQAWAEVSADTSAPGLRATLHLSNGASVAIDSALIGKINAYNLLVCAQIMQQLGFDADTLAKRLAKLTPPPGRMECIPASGLDAGDRPRVVVDYAHSPDALRDALLMLRPMCQGQLWCVFGCGGDRDPSKRAPMGRVAESVADRVVLTDDNPRHESSLAIIRAIQSGMRHPERARVLIDRAEAIGFAIEQARPDDVVLVAGKGHETEQIVGDRRIELDDRLIAQQAVDAWTAERQEAG
ncbi:MAG TPA: UDP-N-acetylmuramoyl-L-alanyl-D-glutamate--2,6-diaminopimelate ligase [Wenzhouxiangella sp.]